MLPVTCCTVTRPHLLENYNFDKMQRNIGTVLSTLTLTTISIWSQSLVLNGNSLTCNSNITAGRLGSPALGTHTSLATGILSLALELLG